VSEYDTLLEVQAHDTTVDQLRHRRAHLPERAELAEVDAELSALAAEVASVTEERDDRARQQRRIEDEVTAIEAKLTEVDGAMYGGSITSPKELQALQDETGHLKRRQSTLEDQVLELMEALEPLEARLAELDGRRATLDGRAQELLVAAAEAEAGIEADLVTTEAERTALAGDLPSDLLAQYEAARVQFRGVAVARIEHNTCGGCHLRLSAMEVDNLKHLAPGEVVTCGECGRLLVP
jgi:predicted  nucleic acid-binding Zn-ribbon protein